MDPSAFSDEILSLFFFSINIIAYRASKNARKDEMRFLFRKETVSGLRVYKKLVKAGMIDDKNLDSE